MQIKRINELRKIVLQKVEEENYYGIFGQWTPTNVAMGT